MELTSLLVQPSAWPACQPWQPWAYALHLGGNRHVACPTSLFECLISLNSLISAPRNKSNRGDFFARAVQGGLERQALQTFDTPSPFVRLPALAIPLQRIRRVQVTLSPINPLDRAIAALMFLGLNPLPNRVAD
ncbi:hypothetical protein [Comamonas sp.]|uniref:hypothetical protein n=1 Tax=Comamonas sp. TaxID=34028 RepID=UPI002588D215|nr:hypothetical protein [Comamonas sp.]